MKRIGRSEDTQTTSEWCALTAEPAGYGTFGSASSSSASRGGGLPPRTMNSERRSTHSSIQIIASRSKSSSETTSERNPLVIVVPMAGTARKLKSPSVPFGPTRRWTPKHIAPAGTRVTKGRRLTLSSSTSSTAKMSRWPSSTQ